MEAPGETTEKEVPRTTKLNTYRYIEHLVGVLNDVRH